MRDRKGMDVNGRRRGEEQKAEEKGEIIITIYYVRKISSVANKKRKKNCAKILLRMFASV